MSQITYIKETLKILEQHGIKVGEQVTFRTPNTKKKSKGRFVGLIYEPEYGSITAVIEVPENPPETRVETLHYSWLIPE